MRLYHRVDGAVDSPPLLLSGSLGTTLAFWDAQVEAFSPFRLIRYDSRGHGRSPVPNGPYSIDALGRDVLGLLDELELEHVSFCGLSIGGMVGMWLAAEAPERIDRLVLCCTAPALPPPQPWLDRATLVRSEGVKAVADAVLARWFTPEAPAGLVGHFREMLVTTPREGYAACCEAIAALDLHDRLPVITAPTLVVTGANDPVAPPSAGEALAAAIPGARHVTIPRAAHIANAEQPDAFARALLAHLTEEAR